MLSCFDNVESGRSSAVGLLLCPPGHCVRATHGLQGTKGPTGAQRRKSAYRGQVSEVSTETPSNTCMCVLGACLGLRSPSNIRLPEMTPMFASCTLSERNCTSEAPHSCWCSFNSYSGAAASQISFCRCCTNRALQILCGDVLLQLVYRAAAGSS